MKSEPVDIPTFEEFVRYARNAEKRLLEGKERKLKKPEEEELVEYEPKRFLEKTYLDMLHEIEKIEKIIATAWYDQKMQMATLEQLLVKQAQPPKEEIKKKKEKKPEKKKPEVKKEEAPPKEKKEVPSTPPPPEAKEEKPKDKMREALAQINGMSDLELMEYARQYAPEIYGALSLGGMTMEEFREKIRKKVLSDMGLG